MTKLGRLENLKILVKEFPTEPGVYLMKSQIEKILYVGKAKNLRNRVRSYLLESDGMSPKTKLLASQIYQIEYIITKSEVEAFLLEASLIKKHRPKYNIRLKDDRSYPYIRASMSDTFPRLYLSRKVEKNGSLYFGPFASGFAVFETIRILNHVFQIRDCSDHFMKSRKRPCMTHQIGRCTAPCVSYIDEETYRESFKAALLFLRGRDKTAIQVLTEKMTAAAREERFEVAAKLRDGIEGLRSVLQKQSVINDRVTIDQDAIGFVGDERGSLIETVHVRSGRVMGSRPHFIGHLNVMDPKEDVRDWMSSFLNQYYSENVIPDEILIPISLGDDITKLLQAVLSERAEKPIRIKFSADSTSVKLLQMAEQNAKDHFRIQIEKSDLKGKGLEEIKRKFDLDKLPIRIECFDISHFQGQETVASQVVFEEGVPSKENYRLYKMRTLDEGAVDDYKSMKEVLERRMKHTEYDEPDLILIDGGKGQLKIASEVLKELGRSDIPLASIAKARTTGEFQDAEVSATEERFFLPGRLKPIVFAPYSEAFRILVSLRDEAHRFAISFHRKLREASGLEGVLDTISGLGQVRRKKLMEEFETVDAIRAATVDQIAEIKGFNKTIAEHLLEELKK